MPKPVIKEPVISIAEPVKQEVVHEPVLDLSPMSIKTQPKQIDASLTTALPPLHPADLIEPVHTPIMTTAIPETTEIAPTVKQEAISTPIPVEKEPIVNAIMSEPVVIQKVEPLPYVEPMIAVAISTKKEEPILNLEPMTSKISPTQIDALKQRIEEVPDGLRIASQPSQE